MTSTRKRPGRRPTVLPSIAVLAALLAACAMTPPGVAGSSMRAFSISLSEVRSEDRPGPGAGSPSRLTFRSELSLFGHIVLRGTRVATYNDSLRLRSESPLAFTAFLSRDTLYAESPGGPNIAQAGDPTEYDTMLSCLFTGPALEVTYDKSMRIERTEHFKDSCQAASYQRFELPRSLGMFLLEAPRDEPWGMRSSMIADPEGNLIEVGSWNTGGEKAD